MMNTRKTANQFIQTTKDIDTFIGEKYKMGNYTKKIIEVTKNITLTIMGEPTPEDNGKIDLVDQATFGRRPDTTQRSRKSSKKGCRRRIC